MNPPSAPPRRDFIGRPAPPGYVAGVGRGATGFTTRSDIGPARDPGAAGSSEGQRPSTKRAKDQDDDEELYLNESNYDEFAGYGGSLFNKDPYGEDDEEADKIYEAIDRHQDERGKALRETKTRQELELYRQKRPKIQQQFTDLKASLGQVSEAEWMSIPEVGDARNRKQRVARQDKFTPVPDSLLAHQAKLAAGGERLVYIDPKAQDEPDDDEGDTPLGLGASSGDTKDSAPNIDDMSNVRSSFILSRISSRSLDGQATANPQDYLTDLQAIPSQITDAATLREYRKQFASLRASNPTFANAWIASVRLEEAAGKLRDARSLILAGCEQCPRNADLWCEAIRLHPADIARPLMVRALREIPRSVKLWIKAADLETDEDAKRRVYANARQMIPKSVLLWKKSVELEPPEGAQKILSEAVECCPEAVELWLALARLLPYAEAQRVLIKASEQNPTDRSIWITAAKLEEAAGNKSLVGSIVGRSIEKLSESGIQINRDEWLKEAVDADRANFSVTCHEIIRRVIGLTVGEKDKLGVWLSDARKFAAENSIACARGVYEAIVSDVELRKMESVWLAYVEFERQHGDDKSLESILRRATSGENCAKSETLWLKLAESRRCHLDETRQILSDALDANPDSEKIIIAAVELESENKNFDEARRILSDARRSAETPQLVLRSARLEWSVANLEEAARILKAGIEQYRCEADLYLTLGQIEEQRGDTERAKSAYAQGLKFSPTTIPLWIGLARIEEQTGFPARARSKLEMARLRNPKVASLWLEAARLELRLFQARRVGSVQSSTGKPDAALAILAKGVRECRGSADCETLSAELDLINKGKFT